jgi:hypothetical protein
MVDIFKHRDLNAIAALAPMKRAARPKDVGYVVLFLATHEASFVISAATSSTEAIPPYSRYSGGYFFLSLRKNSPAANPSSASPRPRLSSIRRLSSRVSSWRA